MVNPNLLSRLSVADLLNRYPQVISLFTHYRMACVGCEIAAFHTVGEAVAIYGIDPEIFTAELVCKIRTIEMDEPKSSSAATTG